MNLFKRPIVIFRGDRYRVLEINYQLREINLDGRGWEDLSEVTFEDANSPENIENIVKARVAQLVDKNFKQKEDELAKKEDELAKKKLEYKFEFEAFTQKQKDFKSFMEEEKCLFNKYVAGIIKNLDRVIHMAKGLDEMSKPDKSYLNYESDLLKNPSKMLEEEI